MEWKDLGKSVVDNGLKIIGGLLCGEAGSKVGSIISDALGCANNPEAIKNAIENNPEAVEKIRQLENSQEIAKLQLLFGSEANNLADVKDSRDMQKEALKQDDKFSKQFIYWFALGWSVFAMVYISLITFADIPIANQRFADTILGFLLATAMGGILQFFFGSSMGARNSQEKMLQKM